MKIGELIAEGEARLEDAGVQFGQGTQNAWDESRWLTLAAMQIPVDSPADIEDEPVDDAVVDQVRAVISRRIEGREPAAYITGIAWLKGYAFHVDPRVIVPRSFLAEVLLDQAYPWVKDPDQIHRVLDLCTGSGCLAIIAADAFPNAQMTASDLSTDALAVAKKNIAAYGLEARIETVASDLFDHLTGRFDLIVSNPPYVPPARQPELPPEFLHEPQMALIAEDQGMAIVRRILAQARDYLNPQGLLIVEVGHEKEACDALCAAEFSGLPLTWLHTEEQEDKLFLVDAATLQSHPWRPRS
jgi:ribosomal protein L3 glutamine methyltransferase